MAWQGVFWSTRKGPPLATKTARAAVSMNTLMKNHYLVLIAAGCVALFALTQLKAEATGAASGPLDSEPVLKVPESLNLLESEKRSTDELAKLRLEAERFAESYRKEETPDRRMALCIHAINHGQIATGVPVEILRVMFGLGGEGWNQSMALSVTTQAERRGGVEAFIIHFMKPSGNLPRGWYLYVRYSSDLPDQPVWGFYLSTVWPVARGD
jgi:hypothetical protein